jgi:hypothetical protein
MPKNWLKKELNCKEKNQCSNCINWMDCIEKKVSNDTKRVNYCGIDK